MMGRYIYPFLIFFHHLLKYTLLQVLEAPIVVLVLGPEHCANFWHASLEGVRDFWICTLMWYFYVCPPYRSSLSRSWSDCWCSLMAWVCGPLVSPFPFPRMLPLWVSWWGSYFLFFLLGESSVLWGLSCYFFLLAWSGFRSRYLSQIFVWSGFWLGYLSQIFVNDLPSHSFLLSLKIMLENSLFQLLALDIKSLGKMTSRNYSRVDVDLSETTASSNFH